MDDPTSWEMTPAESKKVRKQRADRGFAEQDWWNFNSYLTWVIIQGLEKFKTGAGYPMEAGTMEGWVIILDEMIDGFNAKQAYHDGDVPPDVHVDEWAKPLIARWEKGSTLFIKFYGDLWD